MSVAARSASLFVVAQKDYVHIQKDYVHILLDDGRSGQMNGEYV